MLWIDIGSKIMYWTSLPVVCDPNNIKIICFIINSRGYRSLVLILNACHVSTISDFNGRTIFLILTTVEFINTITEKWSIYSIFFGISTLKRNHIKIISFYSNIDLIIWIFINIRRYFEEIIVSFLVVFILINRIISVILIVFTFSIMSYVNPTENIFITID